MPPPHVAPSRVLVGTSGWAYKEWKPSFYPSDLPASRFLAWYAERLSAVEVNNTFYRMPKPDLLRGWLEQVPAGFRFALKAPQRITHAKKLRDAEADVGRFFEVAAVLGAHAGPVLFQLPPWQKKDTALLADFLGTLPEGARAAFEFRHVSWFDDETWGTLRAAGAVLCIAEDEKLATPPEATADWGYLRLRRQDYEAAAIAAWAERIAARRWTEAYVFFKHEESGAGPRLAAMLRDRLAASATPDA